MYDRHYEDWRDFPKDIWRWRNFSIAEVACKDGSLMVNERSMDMLQRLRDRVGPIMITSAYRSPSHNKKVGGAEKSRHLTAQAFDCVMVNHDPTAFEAAARAIGFMGIGHYPDRGFMHIDTRPAPARWNKGGWFEPQERPPVLVIPEPEPRGFWGSIGLLLRKVFG